MPQGRRCARLAQEALTRRVRALGLAGISITLSATERCNIRVPGAIGHSHRATSQFPAGTVVASLDFEIAED